MIKLTKKECLDILELFKNWNHGQKSVTNAFNGRRTSEDDIYDERRKIILAAYKRLNELLEVPIIAGKKKLQLYKKFQC